MAVSLVTAVFLTILYLSFATAQYSTPRFQPKCTAKYLKSTLPAGVTLVSFEALQANSSYGEDPAANPGFPLQPSGLPALCAVTLRVVSAPDANVTHRVGLFLPLPSAWKSRTIIVGTGGFSGGINWIGMASSTHLGFATAATDYGHISVDADGDWALNNPEKQTDWAWRAIHNTVRVTKAVVAGYYGREAKYRYYEGCSTGGRQGLKELQIDANSFDGVLVGAPAWWMTRLFGRMVKAALDNLPAGDPKHIDPSRFPTLRREIVRQCDKVDGVEDGIISDPDACDFDFEQIRCGANGHLDGPNCFTDAQISVIQDTLSDWVDPADGNAFIHPGLALGSEDFWFVLMGGEEPVAVALAYYRNFVYSDPNWTPTNENFGPQVVLDAERLDSSNSSVEVYDFKKFRDNGGKMIMYQGLGDALIVPKSSDIYYDRVVKTTSRGDLKAARRFFRYFRVPGMSHCGLTAPEIGAPWAFGAPQQSLAFGTGEWSVPGFKDSKHDILLALTKWVETGKPVDSVIATTWKNPVDPTSPVRRQRPICAYPFFAAYSGKGNVDDANSWSCKASSTYGHST